MSERCVRCYVSGQVQGVFFRASARAQAVRLGLRGYARNLHDGRVEVVACGQSLAIDGLIGWLRKGPSQAVVADLQIETIADPGIGEFDIR